MTDMTTGTSAATPPNAGEPTTTDSLATAGVAPTTNPEASAPQDKQTTDPVVPESYELKMPEGVELDKDAADEFTAIAKELKLDQSNAQKLADIGAKMAQRRVEQHAKLVETWVDSVKSDKDIGGDKLEENLGIARKALDTFGTPALKEVLNASGLGNHPEVIRAFLKAGKAISEDGFIKGSPKGPSNDPAKTMFPNMN